MEIFVPGDVIPQGSKKGYIRNGKVNIVDANDKKLAPWRKAVTTETKYAMTVMGWTTLEGPVAVNIGFYLDRPANQYGTGRNAGVIKDSARPYPAVTPDIDKLARAILDALTDAGAYVDDSRVVDLTTWKRYADGRSPGALIQITPKDTVAAAATSPAAAATVPANSTQENP